MKYIQTDTTGSQLQWISLVYSSVKCDNKRLMHMNKHLTQQMKLTEWMYATNSLDWDAKNVLVERSCEVAFKQLVVKDSLGNDAADELEIAKMVWVAVWCRVDGVSHTITRRRTEQSVHWVEDLARYYYVPFTQQTACILTFFSWKISNSIFREVEKKNKIINRTSVLLCTYSYNTLTKSNHWCNFIVTPRNKDL